MKRGKEGLEGVMNGIVKIMSMESMKGLEMPIMGMEKREVMLGDLNVGKRQQDLLAITSNIAPFTRNL